MKQLDLNFNKGKKMENNKGWVIVMTAAGNFIGKQKPLTDHDMVRSDGSPVSIKLDPAFTWINDQVMVAPGQMAMMRQAVPLQSSLGASKLEIKEWIATQNLDEWPDYTRDEILRQVNSVVEGMKVESAKRAGIEIPQGQIPTDLAKQILSKR